MSDEQRRMNGPSQSTAAHVLDNVLDNVIRFLPDRRDRNNASLVCRSWYTADAYTRSELFIGNIYAVNPNRVVDRFKSVRSIVLKGKPRFSDFGMLPYQWGAWFAPWCAVVVRAYPWLERLYLKRIVISDEDLNLISCSLTNFRDLVLVSCDGFGTPGLAAVAHNCRRLRMLELIEDEVEDDDQDEVVDWISMFPETTTSLESLRFDCMHCEVNFNALEALVARSPKLRKLQVNEFVSIMQLARLMARAPQLTHLGTGSFAVQSQADEEVDLDPLFASSKSLLCLAGFCNPSPQHLPSIYPVCANITSLELRPSNISAELFKPVISHCHNIQKLGVMDSIHDDGLQAVAETCKDLHDLRVSALLPEEEVSVSHVGLLAIAEGCRKLSSILYFCSHMTNAAVIAISRSCLDLVVFRLCIMAQHLPDHDTGEPMDEGFGAIVMNCKKLTRLAVSGLLTDKAFAYIGRYGKLIKTLSVAFAGDSDLGLRYLLEGCPKLQKLEIRDAPFGDAALLSGIHHYYNMRFIWMSGCKLTVRGCKEVAQRLPHMVVEVVRNNNEDRDSENVELLYMYRSLAGPRDDAPPFVQIQ